MVGRFGCWIVVLGIEVWDSAFVVGRPMVLCMLVVVELPSCNRARYIVVALELGEELVVLGRWCKGLLTSLSGEVVVRGRIRLGSSRASVSSSLTYLLVSECSLNV